MKRILLFFLVAALSCHVAFAQGEAVDLGLSVLWASCNVGASEPEQFGDYYAWGEVETKTDYSKALYKWGFSVYDKDTDFLSYHRSKYNLDPKKGKVDNRTELEPADDAATQKWGKPWRMPTYRERDELLSECTWTWTKQKDVYGYKVTSKKNGNSIFLPAGGYYSNIIHRAGEMGFYWTSSLGGDGDYAYRVSFSSTEIYPGGVKINAYIWDCEQRSLGFCIRPVTQ